MNRVYRLKASLLVLTLLLGALPVDTAASAPPSAPLGVPGVIAYTGLEKLLDSGQAETLSPSASGSPDPRPGTSTSGFWSWQDYPYAVPDVEPIVVDLVEGLESEWFTGPVSTLVTVPWGEVGSEFSRILLRADVRLVSKVEGAPAVQFDRPLWVWINGVPAMVGTTTQRFNYTVLVDVTHLYNVIVGRQLNVTVALPNWVVPRLGLTGAFVADLKLLLYPGPKPRGLPDDFIPLFTESNATPWKGVAAARLTSSSPVAWEMGGLPEGVSRAFLLIFIEGARYDEFWYYRIPVDRFVYLMSDGVPFAIAQPYHQLFTGSLNPLLWRPVPGIKTLAFEPQVMEITGLLPLLVGPRNISVAITNMLDYWWVFAAIAVYYEPRATGYRLITYSVDLPPVVDYEDLSEAGTTPEGLKVFRYSKRAVASLSSTSLISTVGGSFLAKTTMRAEIEASRLFDEAFIWDNLTLRTIHTAATETSGVGLQALAGIPQGTSNSYGGSLKVDFGFLVFPEGDPSQATPDNPVPANFSLRVILSQDMAVEGNYFLVTSKRFYEASVEARSDLNGTLIFISPTGAIITGLTGRFGDTVKEERAREIYVAPVFNIEVQVIEFTRLTHGYNEWPYYEIREDRLDVKWNPTPLMIPVP